MNASAILITGGVNMLTQGNNHEESMHTLKELALEISEMDEYERLKTLEWVIKLEVEGKGNRFWILIVKCLLGKPELLSSAIKLADKELVSQSDIQEKAVSDSNIRFVNFGKHAPEECRNKWSSNSSLGGLLSSLKELI